ncbi:aminotransferase class V-fold PLP-dependent enzyme [Devosia sp.]|uniref:aminotransferase class V-fold PLP-dependent enzyme n=1 Tax=Devosia sp. TaxID=1871048 RepID=UPI002AFFB982|nr:aminotransferase class V-fold PLP-dependent enzyme [Devosia sp.]
MNNLASHFLLDPDVTFLNHGSFGAAPRPVFEQYQTWQRQLEHQPVAFLEPTRGYSAWLREAREVVAGYLGAQADDLVGVTNATMGLNIVAQSLPLAAGDEILTTDHEYPALDKTWAFVTRRTGARIARVQVPIPLVSEQAFTEALLAGITERTRVIFLSHITSATALRFPIERIISEARARGIWTVIDGAHAPGHIPLELDRLGADFYAGNCHKWMMSPKGAAFLHVRPEWQMMLNPLVISHGWTEDRDAPGAVGIYGNTPFIDAMEMQGTRDPSAFLTVPEAIRFSAEHDWDGVRQHCAEMVTATAARVSALTGLAPLSSIAFRAPQMASKPLPPCDPRWLHQALMDQYNIEIPVFRWQDHVVARISVQGYNTQAQMDYLIEALTTLLTLAPEPEHPFASH